jgi:hypothetical protein
MRCMACGAEMALMNVVQDDTMAVSGFEHHTFMCSGCGDVEQRLVFAKPGEPLPSQAASPVPVKPAEPLPSQAASPVPDKPAEPLPLHAAPPISPAPGVRSEPAPAAAPIPAPGIRQRVFARLRGRQDGGKAADA